MSSSLCTLRTACVCTWLKFEHRVAFVVCAKSQHPYMFHPPSLLFPHGHFDIHVPSSPARPPAMTFPRSVSTSRSPRRATSLSGWLPGQLNHSHSFSELAHQKCRPRPLTSARTAGNLSYPFRLRDSWFLSTWEQNALSYRWTSCRHSVPEYGNAGSIIQ